MASRALIVGLVAAVAAEVVVAGCGAHKGTPSISTIAPNTWGRLQSPPNPIVVHGGNFLRTVTPDTSTPGSSAITATPSVRIAKGSVVVPTTTTFVSDSELDVAISGTVAAGLYDLTVRNPDGASATRAQAIFITGPVALVISTAQEGFPAVASTADVVTLSFTIEDGAGAPIAMDTALTATFTLSSTSASFLSASSIALAGQSGGTLTIHDAKAETVTVGAQLSPLTPAAAIGEQDGTAVFIAGVPHFAHLLDAVNEIPVNGSLAHTHVRVEDIDGNPTPMVSGGYNATWKNDPLDPYGCCISYSPANGLVVIAAGFTTSATFSTSCQTNGGCSDPYSYTLTCAGSSQLVPIVGTISGNTN